MSPSCWTKARVGVYLDYDKSASLWSCASFGLISLGLCGAWEVYMLANFSFPLFFFSLDRRLRLVGDPLTPFPFYDLEHICIPAISWHTH